MGLANAGEKTDIIFKGKPRWERGLRGRDVQAKQIKKVMFQAIGQGPKSQKRRRLVCLKKKKGKEKFKEMTVKRVRRAPYMKKGPTEGMNRRPLGGYGKRKLGVYRSGGALGEGRKEGDRMSGLGVFHIT